ncbi:MAG: molybdenum cofactor guanylyltransferase [Candidatus Kapaibacterium sp.]
MIDPKEISGAVLAGGKSSRMGRDKALIEISGVPLIQNSINLLRNFFEDVFVAGGDDRIRNACDAPIYEDEFPGYGPIAGLHTALKNAQNESVLLISVDMPFVRRQVLRQICLGSDAGAVNIPNCSGELQPLCAIYPKSILPKVEEILKSTADPDLAGDALSLRRLADEYGREVELSDCLDAFFNINTPDDLEAARKMMEEMG